MLGALDATPGGSRGLRLLAHFSYHESLASKSHGAAQREACVGYVEQMLDEAERYDAFSRVDVVVDVNAGNPFADRLRNWRFENRTAATAGLPHEQLQHGRGGARRPARTKWCPNQD